MKTNFQNTQLGLGIAALTFGLMAPMGAHASAHTASGKTPAMAEKAANPAAVNDRMGQQ